MKTYMARPGEITPKWWLVDASGRVTGRLASEIAMILMGKHRPRYTPHVDTGDFVIVVNAEKIVLTGKKWDQKRYTWYTGYPGLRTETAGHRLARKPGRILRDAVRRMLPKNKLATHMLGKLKIYAGDQHPHQAQQPESIQLGIKKHERKKTEAERMSTAPIIEGKGTNDILGTGRRKTSVARVRVRPGTGKILVNRRAFEEYFRDERYREAVMAPLMRTGKQEQVNVIIRVHGGGFAGQADACKLGIARALKTMDVAAYEALRDAGLLTRDGRMKERKKYGLRGARRGTQFSKR